MKRIFLSLVILGSILFTSCENKPDNTIPTEVALMLEKGVVDTTLTIITKDYTYTFKNNDKKELVSKVDNDAGHKLAAVLMFMLIILLLSLFFL